MSEKLFEAKTVEEALQQAAQEFGLSPEDIQHEVVEEKTDDFWGLGETVVVVRAWTPGPEPTSEAVTSEAVVPEAVAPAEAATPEPTPDPEAADEPEPAVEPAVAPFFAEAAEEEAVAAQLEPEPEPPAEPETVPEPEASADAEARGAAAAPATKAPDAPADPDDLTALTVALLGKIFGHMDFECTAQSRIDGDTLQVAIAGADVEYLLDGRGRGLSALELILNHGFRHRTDRDRLKIRVDAGDFRSKRDDELRDIAYQVSHQAKETGTEQLTKPLNPYERRIIHLTLADDGSVSTRSQGTGFLKAVAVIPERRR